MRTALFLVLSFFALVAVAAAILLPRSSPDVRPVRPEASEVPRRAPAPELQSPAESESAPPVDPFTVPSIPFEPAPTRDQPDPADFALIPDADLLSEGKRLWRAGDPAGALARLTVLLGRALAHETRVQALMETGFACRHLGLREREEEALRDAVALAGLDSWQGVFAYNHLGWTLHFKGENREAIQVSDQVLSSPHSNDWLRGRARWLRGRTFEAMGETELAHREYSLLLDEYGETESLADVRNDVKRRRALLKRD